MFQSQSAGQFSLAQIFFFNSSRPSTDGMWPTYIVRQFAYSVSVSLNAIQKHPQRNTWNNHVPSQLKKKKSVIEVTFQRICNILKTSWLRGE